VPDAAPESAPFRTRTVTVLGVIAFWMAVWSFYFTYETWLGFGQHRFRPSFEPWVLSYCLLSALANLAGGLGLLARRRWGPLLSAVAGESWTITSVGFLFYYATMISKFSTPARLTFWAEARRSLIVYSGGALVALGAGVLLTSTLFRPAIRRECGDAETRSGSLPRVALVLWGSFAATVTAFWLRWYVDLWGRF